MKNPYHIKVAPAAIRQIAELPNKKLRKITVKLIEALSINPRPPLSRKIEGMTGLYSETFSRVRLIYKVEEDEVLLLLVKLM